jgi:transcriptional regulator with XRE-family HTH domain
MAKMKSKAGAPSPRRAAQKALEAPKSTVDRGESPAIGLGRTARRLRESQNLTLADVAGRADISSAMLSRLETGRVSPSLETIVALSQALGVTASALMQRVGAEDGGAQFIRAARDWKPCAAARAAATPTICWRPSAAPARCSNPSW